MAFYRNSVIILFISALILLTSTYAEDVYVNPFAITRNPCSEIKNGEFVCLDCETLGLCIQEGGEWHTLEVGTCDTKKKFYCDDRSPGCTLQNECSSGSTFNCQNQGRFPDPYNCKYYHDCDANKVGKRGVCGGGLMYSAAKETCVSQTNSAECKEPKYTCDKPGSMGAWPDNNNIYYICYTRYGGDKYELYPLLYRCDAGKVFDGDRCVTSGVVVATSNTYATTPSNDNGPCNYRGLQAHSNCQKYKACENGVEKIYDCGSGAYFNAGFSACTPGNC